MEYCCDHCGESHDSQTRPPLVQQHGPNQGERYCSKGCKRKANERQDEDDRYERRRSA